MILQRRSADKPASHTAPVRATPVASLRAFFPRLAAILASVLLPARLVRAASSEPIGVLFPDIGAPFRAVFTEIIEGIEEQTRQSVRGYPIAANVDLAELSATLKRNRTKVVVALGRQGLQAADAIDSSMALVVSGVSSVPNGERYSGICLTPDPALLFAQLHELLPGMRRVIVIYNPQHNDWLLKIAREAARALGLQLSAYEASDLAEAARLYESAFASADARTDALWLPIDPTTVDESTILPLALRESWNRGVPIFSSSFIHVKKGALFALYPNNLALGRKLGSLAADLLDGQLSPKGVMPLRQVNAALNLRTAGHIGIAVGPRLQRRFQYLYPPP